MRTGVSIGLVLAASALAILLPVMISRVVIDGIIMGEPNALMPDFGMNALNAWFAETTGWQSLIAACVIYAIFTVLCHVLYHLHRISFARTVLHSLRDMRLDLFAHMERRPASFYDRVAVGRVMTRITNDVQALFDRAGDGQAHSGRLCGLCLTQVMVYCFVSGREVRTL